ncbi:MAG TPA: SRPBCC family protein [Thermoplasmata archaeon]|nr:SRPBCC family protein [Thermoplasmata archaeon]
MTEDRIEKSVVIRAPRDRVWKALTDSREFGRWFGVRFDGPFAARQTARGVIVPSEQATPEETAGHPYLGKEMVFHVERVEPPRRFSYRWEPLEGRTGAETAEGPSTLVEFTLDETPDGTRLTVIETGFSRLPAAHRKAAYDSHDGGWTIQVQRARVHIEQG